MTTNSREVKQSRLTFFRFFRKSFHDFWENAADEASYPDGTGKYLVIIIGILDNRSKVELWRGHLMVPVKTNVRTILLRPGVKMKLTW